MLRDAPNKKTNAAQCQEIVWSALKTANFARQWYPLSIIYVFKGFIEIYNNSKSLNHPRSRCTPTVFRFCRVGPTCSCSMVLCAMCKIHLLSCYAEL